MPTLVEPLERRDHFAAVGLDSGYGVSVGAIRRAAGQNVSIYQALPAPGDRTYLLAERYADVNDTNSTGYLTIIRLNAKGRLDTSFGTGGVALTGRVTQTHAIDERSGLLKLDAIGRLYFADDFRVFRFHADGTTDNSFGSRGAATFASADQKVALADITPVDDGVLVATTKTYKQVEYFAVQHVDRQAKTVWSATHAAPDAEDMDGAGYMGRQALTTDLGQFANGPGGLVLAHIETDYTLYFQQVPPDADNYPDPGYDTLVGVTEENVVVTRFDAAYHGTDVVRKTMRRRAKYDAAAFGNMWTSEAFFDNNNLVLSDDGRFLLAQTDSEVMRLDLKRGSVQRYGIQPALYANFNPSYQLLRDGALYAVDQTLGRNLEPVFTVTRYTYDGTLDKKFGKNGVLTVTPPDAISGVSIDQMFLDATGRLYVLSKGRSSLLTLRRV